MFFVSCLLIPVSYFVFFPPLFPLPSDFPDDLFSLATGGGGGDVDSAFVSFFASVLFSVLVSVLVSLLSASPFSVLFSPARR